ncbi:glycosyltransferase family A protein [Tessaracoccus sp. G1721]
MTVAVVSYNHAPYLEHCLQSLLNQSVEPHIIVVDDSSTDASQTVIRDFVRRSGRPDLFTLLLHQENIGLPAGLNEALRITSTEYFVYLAGDDWSLPSRLEKQIAALDEAGESTGLCYTDCLRSSASGSFDDLLFSEMHKQVWRPDSSDPYRDLLLNDNWIPAPTVMFRTAALRDVGAFDESIAYEDHDSYVRIAAQYRLVMLPEALSVHRELTDGLGRKLFFGGSQPWLEGWIRLELKQLGRRPDLTRELAARLRVRAIRLYKMGGNNELAAEAMMAALKAAGRFDPAGLFYWSLAKFGVGWRSPLDRCTSTGGAPEDRRV